jgi:hypothetical protein
VLYKARVATDRRELAEGKLAPAAVGGQQRAGGEKGYKILNHN